MDISNQALTVAEINAQELNVELHLLKADILEMTDVVVDEHFNLIVSNPPYILKEESAEMRQNVLAFEPHQALFVTNQDPLQFYKAIADFTILNLQKEGQLYFETHELYHEQVKQMLQEKGFVNFTTKKDLQNKPRFLRATLP
jgi:release factor glutamine methyltransferase